MSADEMGIRQKSGGAGAFETALQEQRQRILTALAATDPLAATPIVYDDERLRTDEYVTLVYELHHVQLPELQAAGLVTFRRADDAVARGPRFDEIRPSLTGGDGHRNGASKLDSD